MKLLIAVLISALILILPASAQPLSDATGLVKRLDIETGGHSFEVKTVSNFDIYDHEFDKDKKRLRLLIDSSVEDNLSEIIIPADLLGGDFAFYLDGQEFPSQTRPHQEVALVVLEFAGSGSHTVDIVGTTYLGGSGDGPGGGHDPVDGGGGCLVATAAFGSEIAPQVQRLRELRDERVMATAAGAAFVEGFGSVYYVFSPAVADWERQSPAFREAVKVAITPMLLTLHVMDNAESESDIVGYGIGIILLNLGIYAGAPAAAVIASRRACKGLLSPKHQP